MKIIIIMKLTIFVIFNNHYTVESCTTNQFQCLDGECISSDKRCDDEFHCEDHSDEENCSDVNECPEGLHRCYNGQCVVDLNQCPTPILNQTITVISSTRTSQLQSSSIISTSFDIVSPSSFYMSESSVKETTITSVEYVTPTTEDNAPDNDYFWLLLLVPVIGIIGGIVYWYRNRDQCMRKPKDKDKVKQKA